MLYSAAVLAGRHAGACLEELVEDAGAGEVQLEDYLLDALAGVAQEVLGFQDHEGVNPVRTAAAGGVTDYLGQVLWSKAELVGLELHAALGAVELGDKLDETLEGELRPCAGIRQHGILCPGLNLPFPDILCKIAQG